MFKEGKTKLTLLSLLSALVVVSTAFAGVSIYAQQADDNMTTTEDNGLAGNATSLDSGDDSGLNASETSTAASVSDIFSGLVVCDLGTLSVGDATEVAADLNGTQPTITITVMDRTEIAAADENDTSTAAASSADCMMLGETSTSNATGSTDDATSGANATSDANATSASNATSLGEASPSDEELTTFEEEALFGDDSGNATSAANATDTSNNATSAANTTDTGVEDEGQIVAIDGEDFAPGQVVLVFTDNALIAIDDVGDDGSIDAKVPLDDVDSELRFVESGTMRTATASFAEGDTVIAGSEDQDIEIVMAGDEQDSETAGAMTGNSTATSGNTTSTNSTSTNSTDDSIYEGP